LFGPLSFPLPLVLGRSVYVLAYSAGRFSLAGSSLFIAVPLTPHLTVARQPSVVVLLLSGSPLTSVLDIYQSAFSFSSQLSAPPVAGFLEELSLSILLTMVLKARADPYSVCNPVRADVPNLVSRFRTFVLATSRLLCFPSAPHALSFAFWFL